MKTSLIRTGTALLMGCWLALTPAMQAQNTALIKKSARTAAAGISVSMSNGKAVVTYQGKEVWSGKATSGKVYGKSKVVDGKEYAAAFDGDKVVWQNVAGAAAQVK